MAYKKKRIQVKRNILRWADSSFSVPLQNSLPGIDSPPATGNNLPGLPG